MNNWELGCSYCVRPEYGKESSSLESAFRLGHLSFSVEGSASGKLGPAGTSGVLCSSRRRYYSCSLRLLVPKVMSKGRWWHILEAFWIFSSALHKSVIVESDSLLGELFWTESVEVSFLPKWDQNIAFLGSVDFHHVGRLANGMADALSMVWIGTGIVVWVWCGV